MHTTIWLHAVFQELWWTYSRVDAKIPQQQPMFCARKGPFGYLSHDSMHITVTVKFSYLFAGQLRLSICWIVSVSVACVYLFVHLPIYVSLFCLLPNPVQNLHYSNVYLDVQLKNYLPPQSILLAAEATDAIGGRSSHSSSFGFPRSLPSSINLNSWFLAQKSERETRNFTVDLWLLGVGSLLFSSFMLPVLVRTSSIWFLD